LWYVLIDNIYTCTHKGRHQLLFDHYEITMYKWQMIFFFYVDFVRIDMSNKSGVLGKYIGNKGNNKITELRAIFQRESQNS
jgi:hypothetical protein